MPETVGRVCYREGRVRRGGTSVELVRGELVGERGDFLRRTTTPVEVPLVCCDDLLGRGEVWKLTPVPLSSSLLGDDVRIFTAHPRFVAQFFDELGGDFFGASR